MEKIFYSLMIIIITLIGLTVAETEITKVFILFINVWLTYNINKE